MIIVVCLLACLLLIIGGAALTELWNHFKENYFWERSENFKELVIDHIITDQPLRIFVYRKRGKILRLKLVEVTIDTHSITHKTNYFNLKLKKDEYLKLKGERIISTNIDLSVFMELLDKCE